MQQLLPYSEAIKRLCQQHRVRRLVVFGSALTPAFRPDSDVDLVAEFEPMPLAQYADNYFQLKSALEELLGHPVDLLEAQAIRNPYFRQQLEATQQLLYAAGNSRLPARCTASHPKQAAGRKLQPRHAAAQESVICRCRPRTALFKLMTGKNY